RKVLIEAADDLPQADWHMERDPEPGSIRISFASDAAREAALPHIRDWVTKQAVDGLRVTKGAYSNRHMVDVGLANKRDALATCASLLNVDAEAILRIGDQGQEDGN